MKIACADDFKTYVEVVAKALQDEGHDVETFWGPHCDELVMRSKPQMVVSVLARHDGAIGDPTEDFDANIIGAPLCRSIHQQCQSAGIPMLIVGFGLAP